MARGALWRCSATTVGVLQVGDHAGASRRRLLNRASGIGLGTSGTVFFLAQRGTCGFPARLFLVTKTSVHCRTRRAAIVAVSFPEALPSNGALACGCRKGGLVMDLHAGSGTTLFVASPRLSCP